MGTDDESTNNIDNLLVSAVRNGDIDSLEKYLLTISDPNQYLNRIYDEEHMQKCTLLTIACINGHVDIMRKLLDSYKPDLEISNDILFGDGIKTQQLCLSVTVLWAAAATNNLDIVKLLVEHGAHVNHTTKTNSTPLRSACYNGNIDMARYLVEHGADITIAKENNDTNLAVSVYRKHLKMASYLVDELGCDVNICDNDGRSPLYDAVNCGSLELVEFLLDHGARNFRANYDQISPLMWSAEKRRLDIMYAISSHCSIIEQIEAEELLASSFACADIEDRDIEQSYEHFIRAFQLRLIHNLPKILKPITLDVFNNQQECQTIEQLSELHSNSDSIFIEALLVRERLLGPNNAEYRYSIRYHGAILADNEHHYQAVKFWMYELELRQTYSITMDIENLRHFVSMFSEMVFLSLSIPIEALLTVIKITAEELKSNTTDFDYNFHTLLFLITVISQFFEKMNISLTNRREIYRYIWSINQYKYTTRVNKSSLLHLCLNDNISADDYFIDRTCVYPCLLTVRLLLQCGADINATDQLGNTPLHILVSNWSAFDEAIFELLCNSGAHLDRVNSSRKTIFDIATDSTIKQLIKSKMKISLKCLCARLIQTHHISYHEKLTISLVRFVEEH